MTRHGVGVTALLLLTAVGLSMYIAPRGFTASLLAAAGSGGSTANVVVLSSADPSVSGSTVTFEIAVAPAASSFTYPSGTATIAVDGISQQAAQALRVLRA